MSLKRVAIILVVLALAATAAFVAVSLFTGEEKRPLSTPNFVTVEVRPVDPLDRPESASRANEQAAKVVKMLNDYYLQAFLRPERWEPDPKATAEVAPEQTLAAFFIPEAAPGVTRDLAALGLTDLAKSLSRVDPTKQELTKMSVEFEDDGSAPFAVATVTFQALGTLKEEKEQDGKPVVVQISHTMSLWLLAEGDTYRIFAYSAELKADETVVSGAWGRAVLEGNQ
jgi:hypothetical protein